jgi:hypothetical protein
MQILYLLLHSTLCFDTFGRCFAVIDFVFSSIFIGEKSQGHHVTGNITSIYCFGKSSRILRKHSYCGLQK